MAQTLKLKDAGSKLRQVVESFREKREDCVLQDEEGRSVAAVVPIELYQLYQQEWEQSFAVVDRIREKMKDFDSDFIEAQIAKAVAEVKAEAKPGSQGT